MKHTLLILTLSLFFLSPVVSQELILLDRDNNNITNDTLRVEGDVYENILQAVALLQNASGKDLAVWVRKLEDNLLPGTQVAVSWNNERFPAREREMQLPVISAGSTSSVEGFHGDYHPQGQEGSSFVTFEFFSREGTFDPVKLVVEYTTRNSETINIADQEPALSPPSPNPASTFTNFSYFVPFGVTQASVVIRDLTGRIVLEEPISANDSRLRLNVSGLNNGIFLYSLVLDGKPVITRKLMVAR